MHYIFHSLQNLQVFVLLSACLALCNGYNVLFLAPLNGKSHFLYMSSFVRALLDRGHKVTFLTSNSLSHLNLANYTEVLIDPPFDIATNCNYITINSFILILMMNVMCCWNFFSATKEIDGYEYIECIFKHRRYENHFGNVEYICLRESKCSKVHQKYWITFRCCCFRRLFCRQFPYVCLQTQSTNRYDLYVVRYIIRLLFNCKLDFHQISLNFRSIRSYWLYWSSTRFTFFIKFCSTLGKML